MLEVSLEDITMAEFEACFFRDELDDEFFDEDSLCKDLFKKFELLTPPQTPPQSPPHNPFPPDNITIKTSVDACLEKVRSRIDPLATSDFISDLTPCLPEDERSSNLVANLIQDCMWSGPCLAAAGLLSPDSIKPKKIMKDVNQNCTKSTSSVSSCTEIHSGQCVDPAAVFPYQAETIKKLETVTFNLGSVAETPSPSESEDEDEIDVVTVVAEKMARRHQLPTSTAASNSLNVHRNHLATIHNYHNTNTPPKSYSAPQSPQVVHQRENLHSYAGSGHKRSRPISMPPSPQPSKKQRSLLYQTDLKRVAQKLKMGHHSNSSHSVHIRAQASRSSSDSEGDDTNKRAQHNVLERKRRNDLKYSFTRLRDNVPDLAKQDRSPKVTILKLSSDFIRSLSVKHRKLENEYARVKARHEHMLQKLAALRRECL